jgi:transcriptional regulator with XRE-family HTH domain
MNKPAEISSRLKEARGSLSQEDFAAKIGVSFRTYQYYEGGVRAPKWPVLSKIAVLCGVTVDWLLTGVVSRADRVQETPADYGLDNESRMIMDMLKGMNKEQKRQALRFIEGQKLGLHFGDVSVMTRVGSGCFLQSRQR